MRKDVYEKLCSKCCEIKPLDKFKFRRRIHKNCNECENRDYKHCKSCKLTKHINNFYRGHCYHGQCNSCYKNSDNIKNDTMKLAFDIFDKMSGELKYAVRSIAIN
jgi:hypothetical protein